MYFVTPNLLASQRVGRYYSYLAILPIPGNTVEDWEYKADIISPCVQPYLAGQLVANDGGQLLFVVLNKNRVLVFFSSVADPNTF